VRHHQQHFADNSGIVLMVFVATPPTSARSCRTRSRRSRRRSRNTR